MDIRTFVTSKAFLLLGQTNSSTTLSYDVRENRVYNS